MKRLLPVLLLSLLFALSACDGGISAGYITEKQVEPAWDETTYMTVCVAYDSKGYCTVSTQMPAGVTHHPEEYRFDLKEGEETGWVYVDRATYDAYGVGEHYPDRR